MFEARNMMFNGSVWLPVSATNPLPIVQTGTPALPANAAAPTDRSGTIAAGGTSQQVAAALSTRKWLVVQNLSAEDLYLNFGTAAVQTQPSIRLAPGGSYENPPHFCPSGTINIIGATTGSVFTAKEA